MKLIVRPDLDGVACAVLITTMEKVEQTVYADPKDVDDGTVKVAKGDILANLPYHPNAGLWFDHHDKAQDESWQTARAVPGKRGVSPSAARLVYEYYNSPRLARFEEMVRWTDKVDSADLTREQVITPTGWVLLGFTLDPVFGLKAFYDYANAIVAAVKGGSTIEQILDMPEVRGRVRRYLADADDFRAAVQAHSRLDGNVLVTDFRTAGLVPAGNRFIPFTMFPEADVHVTLTMNREKGKVRVRVGKSIFNRTCPVHVGRLMAEYDGGGLDGAGGCLLDPDGAEPRIAEIVKRLKSRP